MKPIVGIKMQNARQIAADIAKVAKDPVNHPNHYNIGKIEVIAAIDDWHLGFCLGNVIKYVARADLKSNPLEDLKKARWYLDHEISQREQTPNPQ